MSEPGGIVLVGPPGSGKSLVGRLVADRLGRPFVDTDELIGRLTGMPAATHLGERGEPAFRAVERRAVLEATALPGSVVAAGGGAAVDPLNRWHLWHHGVVARLTAPLPVLLARLADDPMPRPLLADDPPAALARLLEEREPAYRAADVDVDATVEPSCVAEELVRAAATGQPQGRRLFDARVARHHPLGPRKARILLGHQLDRETLAEAIAPDAGPVSIVIDRRVAQRASELVEALPAGRRLLLESGERAKTLRRLGGVLEWLAAGRAERGERLVAVGGGTLGDLVGTAAALYARGVPLVQVPTTWLAQADSAIGGKVAVDLAAAKNAAGAFWPPVAVVADVAVLEHLPPARRRDGMAEALKAGLIGDAALWRLVEERGRAALRDDPAARYAIVERAVRVKLAITGRDPFEGGERRTLNLGHTIGHALEIESRFRLAHGTAVALGIRAVAAIAARRGAEPDLPDRIDTTLSALGFPLRRRFDPDLVRAALGGDKKRHRGRQRWILPLAVGRVVEADDVTPSELDLALSTIRADR